MVSTNSLPLTSITFMYFPSRYSQVSLRVGPGHFTSFHAHLCIIANDANVRFAGKPSQGSRTGNVCRGSSLSKRPFAQGEIFFFFTTCPSDEQGKNKKGFKLLKKINIAIQTPFFPFACPEKMGCMGTLPLGTPAWCGCVLLHGGGSFVKC